MPESIHFINHTHEFMKNGTYTPSEVPLDVYIALAKRGKFGAHFHNLMLPYQTYNPLKDVLPCLFAVLFLFGGVGLLGQIFRLATQEQITQDVGLLILLVMVGGAVCLYLSYKLFWGIFLGYYFSTNRLHQLAEKSVVLEGKCTRVIQTMSKTNIIEYEFVNPSGQVIQDSYSIPESIPFQTGYRVAVLYIHEQLNILL